jgi:hypothetical protein
VRSIQPLVGRFAVTNLAGPPLPVASESVEVLIWAQVHETNNRVTGLEQQVRKTLATPEEAYIFGERSSKLEAYRVLPKEARGNRVNPKSKPCIQRG